MEVRLLRHFSMKYNISFIEANKIFKDCNIWNYIEDCYDTLHISGDEYILNDIAKIVAAKGETVKPKSVLLSERKSR